MAYQFSDAVRNAWLDAIEVAIGASPTLEIRSGAAPATCGAADSGTVLATFALPSDFMAAASGGQKLIAGTWQESSADASGTAGHFRIKQGSTTHWQGSVSQRAADGGTGDLKLDQATAAIVAGQQVNVTSLTLVAGGA